MSWTPGRLRHDVPATVWPTAAEAAASRWFSPLDLGPATRARTRTWVPAMVPWRATEDGHVTPQVLAWYRRFAAGRPGVLVVEATGIRDIRSGPLLRISDDRFIPGLRALVDTVREASDGQTRLLIQCIDFLAVKRRPDPQRYLGEFLVITDAHRAALKAAASDDTWTTASDTAVRAALLARPLAEARALLTPREVEALDFGARERVTDVSLPHIRDLPQTVPPLFAAAAQRARTAGFDGVELHFAHAYTMASFLSRTNTRADGWGGSLENRLRLPLAVFGAVRGAVGRDWCVGTRFLGDEIIADGNRADDAAEIGVAFARAGFDFLSISTGGKFDDAAQPAIGAAVYPYTGPSGYECMPTVFSDARGPFGRNTHTAGAIRRAVRAAGFRAPVVAAGGINSFAQAEALIADGTADAVAAARQSLADPDWFAKIEAGRGSDVRRCLFTNYCEALDQKHESVTCQLWDRGADVAALPSSDRSADGKRRLIAPPWEL